MSAFKQKFWVPSFLSVAKLRCSMRFKSGLQQILAFLLHFAAFFPLERACFDH